MNSHPEYPIIKSIRKPPVIHGEAAFAFGGHSALPRQKHSVTKEAVAINIGIRGHDICANDIRDLCARLNRLDMHEIQFAPSKSFPDAALTEDSVREMKQMLDSCGIHVAVYGCYIDPLSPEGEQTFLRHMEFAAILEAGAIGTETALAQSPANETEEKYRAIVKTVSRWVKWGEALHIPVGIEAVTGFPIHSVEKTARLLEDIPYEYLKIIWDPANLIEEANASRQQSIFEEGLKWYGRHIVAVHYKDRPDISYRESIDYCRNHPDIPILLEGIPEAEAPAAVEAIKAYGNVRL